jgi:hypothetical protein
MPKKPLSMYMLYYSERREAIQVKRAGQLSFSWHMLCYSEWKETIQVKKGLDYHLSVVKLVNALLLRKEGNHPGKKRAGLYLLSN